MCDCASLSALHPDIGAPKQGLLLNSASSRTRARFWNQELRIHPNTWTARVHRAWRARASPAENPGFHESLEEFDPGRRNPRRDMDRRVDAEFLELQRELETDEMLSGSSDEDDLVPKEEAGTGVSEEEEVGELARRPRRRGRRQVMRRSSLLAKQVISILSARSLGFVSQLWVDTRSWAVNLLEVRPSLLSGEVDKFHLEDVCQVGDVVLVQDENMVENYKLRMVGLDTLVGCKVVTSDRRNLGKVRGYTFDINSGEVDSLELDSLGISIIPSSLVSTYCLLVEDVLEVFADTIVVREDALSRVQRLTKGFFNSPTVHTYGDETTGYFDFGTQSVRPPDSHRSHRRGRKPKNRSHRGFPRKTRELDDDWELPMDY